MTSNCHWLPDLVVIDINGKESDDICSSMLMAEYTGALEADAFLVGVDTVREQWEQIVFQLFARRYNWPEF